MNKDRLEQQIKRDLQKLRAGEDIAPRVKRKKHFRVLVSTKLWRQSHMGFRK